MSWGNCYDIATFSYTCGYCGENIASNKGYISNYGLIYICHNCHKPSYVDNNKIITPGAIYGVEIKHLPNEIMTVFDEARRCFSISAYTSVIMCCRKLLMHIECTNGFEENQSFGKCVQYLKDEGYLARPSWALAETVLKYGNIANHKLELYDVDDARNILLFTETILKGIYELPAIHAELQKKK